MRSGFVAIVGRPNVGKSTFLNRVLSEKISIVSPIPQTTRNKITGIYTCKEFQAIFLDLPGVQKPKDTLQEYMSLLINNVIKDADVILHMVVADSLKKGKGDAYIESHLLTEKIRKPRVLVVNKIDTVKINRAKKYAEQFKGYNEVYYISAYTYEGINELLKGVSKYFEEGPLYYPKDYITDMPLRFISKEIIREKVFMQLKEEIPHSVAVKIEDFEETDEDVRIRARIYVERDSQKGIIIGAKGERIKSIGIAARVELSDLIGKPVHLILQVKVKKKWRKDEIFLKTLGYSIKKKKKMKKK